MIFIELTEFETDIKTFLNAEKIQAFALGKIHRDRTIVDLNDGIFDVKESPEEIMKLIREAQWDDWNAQLSLNAFCNQKIKNYNQHECTEEIPKIERWYCK